MPNIDVKQIKKESSCTFIFNYLELVLEICKETLDPQTSHELIETLLTKFISAFGSYKNTIVSVIMDNIPKYYANLSDHFKKCLIKNLVIKMYNSNELSIKIRNKNHELYDQTIHAVFENFENTTNITIKKHPRLWRNQLMQIILEGFINVCDQHCSNFSEVNLNKMIHIYDSLEKAYKIAYPQNLNGLQHFTNFSSPSVKLFITHTKINSKPSFNFTECQRILTNNNQKIEEMTDVICQEDLINEANVEENQPLGTRYYILKSNNVYKVYHKACLTEWLVKQYTDPITKKEPIFFEE